MKKSDFVGVLATVVVAVIVYLFLMLASTIMIPTLGGTQNNKLFMYLIIVLIWVLYILYIYKRLRDAKNKERPIK